MPTRCPAGGTACNRVEVGWGEHSAAMAVPTHDDDESVSDLFAFSLPVLERDAPGETSTRPSTSRRPLTAFGSQPPGTGRRPDEQAEQDVTDGPFAFALPTSGSHEDAHSVERPTTARPKTSFGAGEASAFGSFASRPQTATSAQSPPVSLASDSSVYSNTDLFLRNSSRSRTATAPLPPGVRDSHHLTYSSRRTTKTMTTMTIAACSPFTVLRPERRRRPAAWCRSRSPSRGKDSISCAALRKPTTRKNR